MLTFCNLLATVGGVLSNSNSDFAMTQSFDKIANESAPKNCGVVVKNMDNLCAFLNLTASSRPQLLPCLIDGSTETFWESGDEVYLFTLFIFESEMGILIFFKQIKGFILFAMAKIREI